MPIKVEIRDLCPGMFVCNLDRPWLETPFLFQGFLVENQADIDSLAEYCQYVYVDEEKCPDRDVRNHLLTLKTIKPQFLYSNHHTEHPILVPVEEEIAVAAHTRRHARKFIDRIFVDIEQGNELNIEDVKTVVSDMVDSIVRNPNAHMCLTQLKNRDEYTAQHSVNVCALTIAFGRHLGMNKTDLNLLGMAALLHDIGKLETPLEILNKPGRLTGDEFLIMKQHPEKGAERLKNMEGIPAVVIDVVFSHHERLAGHGYPQGLNADEISYWSRLVAIVDVYDAITSDRCYHDGMKATEALTKMYSWREKDFDPELMEQFIHCIGIYPIGSLVELSNGEVGIVITLNQSKRLKPKLMLVLDEQKNPYFPTRILDLATIPELDGTPPLTIKTVLEPGSHNINTREYISDLQEAQLRKMPPMHPKAHKG